MSELEYNYADWVHWDHRDSKVEPPEELQDQNQEQEPNPEETDQEERTRPSTSSSSQQFWTASLTSISEDQDNPHAYGAAPDSDMNLGGIDFSEMDRRYRITPIQQPERSASFEGAYLSRLPLAPPLILQLDCWEQNGELTIPFDELPFLVCHLTLQTTDGEDATMVMNPDDGQVVSMLYGTLVATPSEMTDRDGAQGVYFAFPDVSVRYVGRFRLKASLHRITGGQPLDTCYTEPFEIVRDTEYFAPPVTDLTRHFDAQAVVRFGLPRSEW